MDYSKFFSRTSCLRKASCISELRDRIKKPSPSLVWLASGMPNPEKFPFRSLTVTLEGEKEVTLSSEALSTGLQYGPSHGYPPLVEQLKRMMKQYHDPPCWAESDLMVTVGNQDGVCKAFEMLLDPGDFVILQDPSYSDVLCMLSALSPQYLAVGGDEHGMRADLLRSALEEAVKSGSPGVPKVLIHELLATWGDEGFKKHISDICQFYKEKRDAMLLALQTHLTGICEWVVPEGGIFIWLKALQLNDTTSMLMDRALERDIVLVPGKEFMVDPSKPCPYMRAAYALVTPDQMMKGIKNLAKLIQEEIELQSTQA